MIYNNLIYFLIAIFSFTFASEYTEPMLPWWGNLVAAVVLLVVFDRLIHRFFRDQKSRRSKGYFAAEKRAGITALLVFALLVFLFGLKHYLGFLSLGGAVPALVNIGGVFIFLLLLLMVWNRAQVSYEMIFLRAYSKRAYLLSNIKVNLPIIIPWIILTLCYDLLILVPWPRLQEVLHSTWGDLFFFGTFFIFVLIFFPPLVRSLWGAKRIGEGPLRDHLHDFCKRQNISAEFYIWPLFEGRVITAGVMGVIPGLRYILITPALLESLNLDELNSVIAHEIGHVKRFHLILYVFLIGGFSITVGLLGEMAYTWLLSGDLLYRTVAWLGVSPQLLRNIIVAVPFLLVLLLFFRFVFGYFMRNFERQADLHVITAVGTSRPIISAFEKIAVLSGNIRDQPSWHHFGIGERIEFLQKCEANRHHIQRHHAKVNYSIGVFAIVLLFSLLFSQVVSMEDLKMRAEDKYLRADLLYGARQDEDPVHWLDIHGNYLYQRGFEKWAVTAYELAMEMEPQHPDMLNNYAWLLLTVKDFSLRDPLRALQMAKMAAEKKPTGAILDTLATAWWANGNAEQAVRTERQAVFVDPESRVYYQQQIKRFQGSRYGEEFEGYEPSK